MSGPAAGNAGTATGNPAGPAEGIGNAGPATGNPAGASEGAGTAEGTEKGQVDYEAIAREKGWRPQEEFEGPTDVWVGAEEFVKRQPLYDKLKLQSKQLKELGKTVDAMASHYNITIKQAREKAIAELRTERREAIELGEVTKVEELDKQIEDIRSLPEPAPEKKTDPTITQFVEDNKEWFNVDKTMTRFAVTFNETYLAEHPGELEESLKETMKAVKAAFPDKFVNKRRENPPPVDTGGAPAGQGGGKYTMKRLTPEQKLVYDQLVTKHKQLTHEEYFKSLDDAGYLEG